MADIVESALEGIMQLAGYARALVLEQDVLPAGMKPVVAVQASMLFAASIEAWEHDADLWDSRGVLDRCRGVRVVPLLPGSLSGRPGDRWITSGMLGYVIARTTIPRVTMPELWTHATLRTLAPVRLDWWELTTQRRMGGSPAQWSRQN